MVAAIVAVVGFVGFTLFSGGDKGARPGRRPTDSLDARQAGAQPRAPTRPTAARQAPSPPTAPSPRLPADKVTVKADRRATARAGSPPRTTTAGCSSTDGLLKQGESKTFTDKERIDLVLGNAGAVQLYVNGKEVEAGRRRRVRWSGSATPRATPRRADLPRRSDGGPPAAPAGPGPAVPAAPVTRRQTCAAGGRPGRSRLSPCPNAVPSPLSLLAAPVTRWTRRSSQAAWQRTAGSSSRKPRTRTSPSSTPAASSRPPRRTPSTPCSKPTI